MFSTVRQVEILDSKINEMILECGVEGIEFLLKKSREAVGVIMSSKEVIRTLVANCKLLFFIGDKSN